MMALAIVRNKPALVADGRVKLIDRFVEFPGRAMAIVRPGGVKFRLDGLHHLQRLEDIPVPQVGSSAPHVRNFTLTVVLP
jgi:hypothetical protein